ncbi:hypothetical protein QPK24_05120 [Paenibacillus polygoni]|uniref:Uncharacterized protein n=1 Tax=Paenibacillus polygoni TaxID=3050112 RepID=A0ABY8X6I9_9BACL|nr:hypothetical protein [Paenibacillus polygoni]WIV20101.1 hypothetical protein QPK24_05120 [Paenibacillus polygoni]
MNQINVDEHDLKAAVMYIHKYQEQIINSKSRPIMVMGISGNCITFVSDLYIPVIPQLEIGLVIQDELSSIHSFCTLKWKQDFGSFTLYHAFLHNLEEQKPYINGQLNWMIQRMPYLYELRPLDRIEEWSLIRDKIYNKIDLFI